mmetsp:Transcript_845/g.1532  ORF Transcript_845/g.1532 Transcript_845/m.1532 type:complete len:81 (-) Transcript_845:1793-2035(-)
MYKESFKLLFGSWDRSGHAALSSMESPMQQLQQPAVAVATATATIVTSHLRRQLPLSGFSEACLLRSSLLHFVHHQPQQA